MDYTVRIAVKPYIKAYLENNFGIPVDIRKDGELWELTGLLLREGSARFDKSVAANFPEQVDVLISRDIFFRYGYVLTKTETLRFNAFVEKRVKFFARNYIAYHHSLGTSVADCIRDFQKIFGFPEDVWPYDSIKKDFDRHGRTVGKKAVMNFKAEMSRIFLEMLSESGTGLRIVAAEQKEVHYG